MTETSITNQTYKNAVAELSKTEFSSVADCRERISGWLSDACIDSASKDAVVSLINDRNITELRDSFYRELEFGTGGLRGVIGAGNNRMNRYVVRRATQGLANFIKKQGPDAMRRGVAIAYDSRHFSTEFAHESASVLAANGIHAHVFKTLNTTPALSFAVRALKCISGICVTASHNPPQYNGFKVYWDDGAQLVPPIDAGVLTEVFAVKSFSEAKFISFEDARKDDLVHMISNEIVEGWYSAIQGLRLYPELHSSLKIVYTPLHGTGAVHAREVLRRWGFQDVFVVPEQEAPDGEFPTVKKPNPEEPEALKLAVAHAARLNADIVLATDPDSDRLALVVRDENFAKGALAHQAMGNYVLLNGNQTGALMLDYILDGCRSKGRLRPSHKIVKTIVTSELHKKICATYGVEVFNTLTGFKWIASLVREWETKGMKDHEYLFGTEESFGYMPGTYMRDKDGIGALAQAAEMCAIFKARGKTACERLFEIFGEHGAWQESLINVDLVGEEGAARIRRMMESMRQTPSKTFGGVGVAKVFDYKMLSIQKLSGDKFEVSSEKINLPVSDVLQFELSDGSRISMRPSGTEPKIKFYVSVCTKGKNVMSDYSETLARIERLNNEINAWVAGVK
jgi:phosphoglucomutase